MTSPALAARLAALEQRAKRGMDFGLTRVLEALAQLGDPHAHIPAVHVAGTNGKGSVSAMTESIARAAGLRTGLYTSPHLCRIAERIRIDGEPIEDDAFAGVLRRVEEKCHDRLTFFEILTVAAFEAFVEAKVDVAVVEVGLGGRLDATNVIPAPIATAITSIALEHTAYLGTTLASVAGEKAGILKPGAPVVLGPLDPEAGAAIAERARATGAGPIWRVPADVAAREEGDAVVLTPPAPFAEVRTTVGLRGPHQIQNAAVAAGLAYRMTSRWPAIAGAIGPGIAAARWPGRYERLTTDGVEVLLDCAHNPHGIAALAETRRRERLDPARTALVFGALADKDWPAMLAALAGFADRRYFAEPKGRAPVPAVDLPAHAAGVAEPEPRRAIRRAVAESRPGDTVIVAGSIYLVGEVRSELLGIEADPIIAL